MLRCRPRSDGSGLNRLRYVAGLFAVFIDATVRRLAAVWRFLSAGKTAAARGGPGEGARRNLGRLGHLGLLLVGVAGVVLFLRTVHAHYPIPKWLFWIYAEVWLCTLACGAACLASGDLIVTGVLRWTAPLRERLLVSFAVGVFIFALGIFIVGLFHGLGAIFFVAWPLGLIAVGAVPLVRTIRRAARLLPHARRVAALPSWFGGVAMVFGLAGVALLYVNILTPGNLAFDSRWYHLAISEHYAAAGAVTRFPEGWFCGTYPHLASLLYTWAMLNPHGDLFTKIELAAHVEFLLFVVTLSGVGMLARWCVARGDVRIRNGWAALFLFPGILLYDSSLSVAADHVLAFWAPPLFLLLRRTVVRWNRSSAFLLGLIMAGAVLTKYQALYLLAVPVVAMCAVSIRAMRKAKGRGRVGFFSATEPLVVTGVAALALTTPLWLKNWIWYRDPVYPMLAKFFQATPWVPEADPDKLLQIANWTPQGPLLDRLSETLKAMFTFSFIPHDWWNLHGSVPVFGSLFTLSLPLLLFVKPRSRVLALASATLVGVGIWFWTYHQDRYLQVLLPWMAAVSVAVLAMAWRVGWTGRIAVAALVSAQVVWGGDVYTFPTHAMMGTQPAKGALDLVSSGFRKDWAAREGNMDLTAVAPLLPKGSKALLHERGTHLGLGAMSVADIPGTQAGISYAGLGSPRRVYDRLHRFRVTHVLWARSTIKAGTNLDDLVFFEFAENYTVRQVEVAGYVLGEMPSTPPPAVAEPRLVRAHICGSAKTVTVDQLDAALAGAPVVTSENSGPPAFQVVQTGCPTPSPDIQAPYRLLLTRDNYQMWGPRRP